MSIDELIAQLQKDFAKYGGDTPVVVWRYTGGDEEPIDVTGTTIDSDTTGRRWTTLVID